MTSLQIKHTSINGGSYINISSNNVTVGGKKNNIASPNANLNGSIVEVQTQSIENLTYNIPNVHFTGSSTVLSYADVLTLYRATFDGTNPAYLKVVYGTATSLVGVDGTTVEIPVILQSFSFPVNVKDSRDGYMPIGNLTFIETATD